MISIVLPAYKARYLREAIKSILSQTYREYELIVVDDCSPENIRIIVEEFNDERIRYYRNDHNIGSSRGLVAAWNHAVSYASGEWLVLASDDDVYGPEFLSEMVKLKDRYPNVKAVHCRMVATDSDGSWRWGGASRT